MCGWESSSCRGAEAAHGAEPTLTGKGCFPEGRILLSFATSHLCLCKLQGSALCPAEEPAEPSSLCHPESSSAPSHRQRPLIQSFTSNFTPPISRPWHLSTFQAALCGALSSQGRAQSSPRTAPKCCLPFIPPEKPLQLAKTIRGSPSLLKSLIAWAVLKAESGNHTCPACWIIWWEEKSTVRPLKHINVRVKTQKNHQEL